MAKIAKTPETDQTPANPAEIEGSPQKKKTGRPSKYDPEIARQMCEQLSDGIPLREICRQEGFPAWRTVYDWMARDDALGDAGVGLSASIARARDIGYDAIAEECLDIADNASNDWMERLDPKTGKTLGWVLNGDHVQRSRLRVETRLKLLAKFHPKKYGEKVSVGGDANNPVAVDFSPFETIIKALETKRQSEANG